MRRAIVIAAGVMLALLVTSTAVGQSNPPSVECASEQWNGDFWKIQINDGSPGQIEASIPHGNVGYSTAGGTFVWVNLHDNPAFRWMFKSGNETTVPWNGWWEPGTGDSATMPGNLSHVTICFADPGDPTTTTTTTEEPTTTTSTTEATSTTTSTTVVDTTTTRPPTTTSTTEPPSTTSTAPPESTTSTSTTATSTTDPPSSSTTETPRGGVQTGAGGTVEEGPISRWEALGLVALLVVVLAGIWATDQVLRRREES